MTFSATTDGSVDPAADPVDPITLEVIRHGLVSAANQVDANITRAESSRERAANSYSEMTRDRPSE